MSRVKRATKMIMLHRYDVENFNYGGEGRNLEERTNVAGAPNIVIYMNNTHRPGISIHYIAKDVAVWPKCTRFDCRYRGDFTL